MDCSHSSLHVPIHHSVRLNQSSSRDEGGDPAMGFLRNLFRMPSCDGATNALLMELMLPKLTAVQRAQLKHQYVERARRRGFPNVTDEAVLSHLNGSARTVQLICLACAMKELGYESPLKDEYWHNVKNPFDPCHSDKTILKAASKLIFSNHRFVVTVGSKPLNFDSW